MNLLIAQPKKTRLKNNIVVLDGVRALACLSVVSFHINLITMHDNVWHRSIGIVPTALALAGAAGVTLFFVLSGFLLFMPYIKSLLFGQQWPSMRTFYLRRALRILPGYYFSLFILTWIVQPQYFHLDHWKKFALFLTLFMDSLQGTYQRINGPYWTLAVEWQFYLLLPFLALGLRWVVARGSLQRRFRILALCLGGVMAWGVFARYWGRYFLVHPMQNGTMLHLVVKYAVFFLYGNNGKYLEDFAVGMLVSSCYILAQHPVFGKTLREKLQRYSIPSLCAGLALLFFMALWNENQWFPHTIPLFDPVAILYDPVSELLLSLGFGLCVVAVLFGPAGLKRPLEWGPLCWLGLISYSLYIWHLQIILFFQDNLASHLQDWNHLMIYGLYWLWVPLMVLPLSYLLYQFIEFPGIHLASKLRATKEASYPAPTVLKSPQDQIAARTVSKIQDEKTTMQW